MSITTKTVAGTKTDVEIIEERGGAIEDDQGYVNPTYNCYAGIGYELDDDLKKTGRIIAWAGNNAQGEVDVFESVDLDEYLNCWDQEWIDQFAKEGLL